MSSAVATIKQSIEQEIGHSRNIERVFLRTLCLFETHCYKRYSTLSEMFPDLNGQTITDAEVAEIKTLLVRFIEEAPSHTSITAAIWILSVSRDPFLKEFFIKQLRLYLGWRHPVAVSTLLAALEDLGEKVFYRADGSFIGSRSSMDTDANFDVAKRYLESYDRAA
jgi:hypothetical protein